MGRHGRRGRGRGGGRAGFAAGRGALQQPLEHGQQGQGQLEEADDDAGEGGGGAIHPVYPIEPVAVGGNGGQAEAARGVALSQEERLLRFQGMLRDALVDRARVSPFSNFGVCCFCCRSGLCRSTEP